MACLRCGSSLPSASPEHIRIPIRNRPCKLELIERSPIHKLTLIDWTAQLSISNDKLVRKLGSRNTSISNLNDILGFFFVFEGVIITAAAQANGSKLCRHSWILFALNLIASVATFFACVQKLREFADADTSWNMEKDMGSALKASIQLLKEQGPDFDVVEGQPMIIENQSYGSSNFWKKWVWSYAGGVLGVLLAFAGTTLVAVNLFLCSH